MSRNIHQPLSPPAVGVKRVKTSSLIPNPHNPRMLFDREPLDVLRNSINKVGILVPLTVYWGKRERAHIILDGQRRWMAATQLKLSHVPVNVVAEPSLVQNIVTMFQIHKLREDWELMPTALKVEVLMAELEEKNDARLAELTGLDPAVVTRCKKLLSYSREFQDMMLDPKPERRIKADFFIELYAVRNDRIVNQITGFSRDHLTRRMLFKYRNGAGIKAVTDFRIMKQHISNAHRVGRDAQVAKRLMEFIEDDHLGLDHLQLKEANVSAGARKLLTAVRGILASVRALDVEEYYGQEALWRALAELVDAARVKLKEAGRRTR